MLIRIVTRAYWHRKPRAALAILSIMIGSAMVAAFTSLAFDLSDKLRRDLRTEGPNVFIGPSASAANQTFAIDELPSILAPVPQDRIEALNPTILGLVRLDKGNAILAGVEFPALQRMADYWQIRGSWISVSFDDRHCMVGRQLAEDHQIEPGDTVTVQNREAQFHQHYTVKAVFESGSSYDGQILLNLGEAQRALGNPGQFHHLALKINGRPEEIDHWAQTISLAHPQFDVQPMRKLSHGEGQIFLKIRALILLVTILMVLAATLAATTTLMALITDRLDEIGLMKSLGAETSAIRRMFALESLLLTALGGPLGLLGGYALAQFLGWQIFGVAVQLHFWIVPVTLCAALLSAIASIALPMRTALRVDPIEVLRQD